MFEVELGSGSSSERELEPIHPNNAGQNIVNQINPPPASNQNEVNTANNTQQPPAYPAEHAPQYQA